jgi:hypothetical protein
MALITKPNMQQVWASGGDIVEPSDLKKQQGWTVEVPPHQFENWIQNRQDEYLAHINQRGIPAWDGLTNYEAGGLSYVQGSDGKVYKSVAASGPSSVVSNPTTDGTDTYWTVAFADVGAFLTQAAGDTRYTQRSNNLSDLPNAATARTNLGVDAVIAALPFTKGFTSSEQVITLAGSLTIAHSLSASPKLLAGEYVCKTAEHGYSIGDVLVMGFYGDSSSTVGVGTSVVKDATNLYVRFGSAPPVIINKTTGSSASITVGNWRFVLRAWA